MSDILLVLNASRNKLPPEERPTTTSPQYPHLPALTPTPTPTRQRPASEPDTKQPVFESEQRRFGGGYNGYDMKGLDDKRVGDRKGEEHGYGYEQGPPPAVTSLSLPVIATFPPAVTSTVSTSSITFRPKDIGYFDPHLDDAYEKGDIIQLENEVCYCDVHLFLDQAKSMAMVKGPLLIHNSLFVFVATLNNGTSLSSQTFNENAYTEASDLTIGSRS